MDKVAQYVYPPPIGARQQLGKHVPMATNTHTAIELLDASFSMQSMSCQKESRRLAFPTTRS
jgi:hypothetical protein